VTLKELIKLYEKKKKIFGPETYKYISELLKEAKEISQERLVKISDPEKRP